MAMIEQISPEPFKRDQLAKEFENTYEQVRYTLKRGYYENFEGFQDALNGLENLRAMYEIFKAANRNL